MTFGTPIVYNPILFFPFVIGNGIMAALIYLVFDWGFVPKPFMEPPGFTPFVMQGFLVNMSWKSVVLQLVIILASTLMYWPFFKIMERQEILLEQKENNKDQ